MAHFIVIGLGRFGITTSLELTHLGHTVTGVDSSRTIVDKYANDLFQTIQCDATDERAIDELDINHCEAVLVAIGENMESSMLCTLYMKNRGVKNLWVKATSKAHHTILMKLGVSRIIHPEEEMGIKVAQALNYPMVNNYLSLGHNMFVVEVNINERHHKQTLASIKIDKKSKIKPLLVKRDDKLFDNLDASFVLNANDILVMCGTRFDLQEIAPSLA